MWKALLREGIEVARCTVERLMSTNGIQGAKRRGKPWRTTTPDPAGQDAPDLVERDFAAETPNRLWVVDFTYLRTWEGVVFFAFVIDVFSRMIVGWQFATHMRRTLVLDALRMALGLRAPGADAWLVHHSDRGSQYTSDDYTQTLDDHDVARSLGSTGDCYDNALAESFVDSFKTELIADRVWRTHEQAELTIVEWVGWFNHQRLHSSLGDIPPAEHEANWRASAGGVGDASPAGAVAALRAAAAIDALEGPVAVPGLAAQPPGDVSRAGVVAALRASAAIDALEGPGAVPGLAAQPPGDVSRAGAAPALRAPAAIDAGRRNSLARVRSTSGSSARTAPAVIEGRTADRWSLRPVVEETYSLTETSKPPTSTTKQPT